MVGFYQFNSYFVRVEYIPPTYMAAWYYPSLHLMYQSQNVVVNVVKQA